MVNQSEVLYAIGEIIKFLGTNNWLIPAMQAGMIIMTFELMLGYILERRQ